jgi:hypothetical protein
MMSTRFNKSSNIKPVVGTDLLPGNFKDHIQEGLVRPFDKLEGTLNVCSS